MNCNPAKVLFKTMASDDISAKQAGGEEQTGEKLHLRQWTTSQCSTMHFILDIK
jgi:hypothetical protein